METQILTTQVSQEVASKVENLAHRLGQSKSWIMQHALAEWIATEEERYYLTKVAMQDVRNGHTISQESVSAWAESLGTKHQFPYPDELVNDAD